MIKNLIFDLDRTVYPAHCEMSNSISFLIKKYASDFWHVDFEEGAKLRSAAVRKFGTTLDWLVEAGGFTDIEDYFAAVHPADECKGLYPLPGLRPLLTSLPQTKVILTNSPYEHADRVLSFLGVRDLFCAICDIRMNKLKGKPAATAYEKALELFQQAYVANNKKAARYLGMLYEQGLGVEQDYAKAAEYYKIGIENGDLTSSYYLGLLYEQGLGVDQDYGKAADLFASIAESNNKSATGVVAAGFELGTLYEQGLGVEQDLDKAIKLYQEAALYENKDAIEALARLSE